MIPIYSIYEKEAQVMGRPIKPNKKFPYYNVNQPAPLQPWQQAQPAQQPLNQPQQPLNQPQQGYQPQQPVQPSLNANQPNNTLRGTPEPPELQQQKKENKPGFFGKMRNYYDEARMGWELGKVKPEDRWQSWLRNENNPELMDNENGETVRNPKYNPHQKAVSDYYQNRSRGNARGQRRVSRQHQPAESTVEALKTLLSKQSPQIATLIDQALNQIGYYEQGNQQTQQNVNQPPNPGIPQATQQGSGIISNQNPGFGGSQIIH
jgi:hypothetical protein